MPELPEVEATRRHLAPVLTGRVITDVEVGRGRMLRRQPPTGDFAGRLRGRRVEHLGRHGKMLLAELDDAGLWVTHLGMSGRFSVNRPSDPRADHTHLVVSVDDVEIRMVDPRTFGFFAAFAPGDDPPHAEHGPDALLQMPSTPDLLTRLRGRSAPIKALLLDQRFLAGVGNIYADEALWRARIRPDRSGGDLDSRQVGRLRRAVPSVLEEGLALGGTSLDDLAYLLPDGRAGDYTRRLAVYGRPGERCRRCGGTIQRIVIRQRSSFFCESCQV